MPGWPVMAVSRLKIPGAHRVTKTLSTGKVAIYWYRHRGGPLLMRLEGDTRRHAEQMEHDQHKQILAAFVTPPAKAAPTSKIMSDLIRVFRQSPEGLPSLAPSTRAQWSIWLDRIDAKFGEMPIRLLKAKGAKRHFTEWRDTYADRPRSADYAVQVLRRVLSIAIERELIDTNPAEGIKQLYRANRADRVITDAELETILSHATPRARYAIRLAAATGLRRGDLVELKWDQVRNNRIEFCTKKSRGRTFVIAPLVGDGRAVIDELLAERAKTIAEGRVPSAWVLTTERGSKWLGASLTQAFIRAAKDAKVERALHDLRGTAATRMILQGIKPQEVATFIGWERNRVDQIIQRYVDPERIAREAITRLEPRQTTG